MSTRTHDVLVEIAAAAGAASGLGSGPMVADQVLLLRRRVRRARAVRAAGTTAVAAALVGALAVGVPALDRPPALPAGDPLAAAGTCGSLVQSFPTSDPDVFLSVESAPGATTGRANGRTPAPAGWSDAMPVHGTLSVIGRTDPERPRLTVVATRDDVVVATTSRDMLPVEVTYPVTENSVEGAVWTSGEGSFDLVRCDTGDRLPEGAYEMWAFVDGERSARVGPWTATVLPPATPVTGLPAAFPVDVPVIGEEVTSVRSRASGGWEVEVAVTADDALDVALAAMTDAGAAVDHTVPVHRYVSASGWWVVVSPGLADGRDVLRYRLSPPSG